MLAGYSGDQRGGDIKELVEEEEDDEIEEQPLLVISEELGEGKKAETEDFKLVE